MPLDPTVLQQIRDVGGAELEREMFEMFLANAPARLSALSRGVDAGDRAGVADAAHSIRSSAASVGAHALAERAGELERLARELEGEGLAERYAALELALVEVLGVLRVRLAD